MAQITFTYSVDGDLTDATSVKLSNPTGTYGLRRQDTSEVIVANDTALVHASTGTYTFDLDALDLTMDETYDFWVEVVFDGETTRFQRFITGVGTTVSDVALRFVLIDQGAAVVLDTPPLLSNPTASFGVVRTDTGATIVADGAEWTATGALWTASFGEPTADLEYRYYVRVDYPDAGTWQDSDGIWFLPRTTKFMRSAALVLGRYTNSYKIESRYGVENVHLWLGIDAHDEAVDYGFRLWEFIRDAESYLDDELRGHLSVPEEVPIKIADLATDLAALRMYESRGVVDVDGNGFPMHRLSFAAKRVEKEIDKIKGGQIRLSTDVSVRIPSVLVDPVPVDPRNWNW